MWANVGHGESIRGSGRELDGLGLAGGGWSRFVRDGAKMSAPYKRMEFTASSGNICCLKVYAPVNKRRVVDAEWDHQSSPADRRECDEWFSVAAGSSVHRSIYIEDSDEAKTLIAAMTQRQAHG